MSAFGTVYKVITFVPRKVFNYTSSLNKLLKAPLVITEKMSAFEIWCTRMFGTCTAGPLFGLGAADAVEAYACDDGICFLISCIGCGFDVIGFLTNFVPGPNITQIITLPGSAGCKVFVHACKNRTLPWKGC